MNARPADEGVVQRLRVQQVHLGQLGPLVQLDLGVAAARLDVAVGAVRRQVGACAALQRRLLVVRIG